jgi:hypothetical protein
VADEQAGSKAEITSALRFTTGPASGGAGGLACRRLGSRDLSRGSHLSVVLLSHWFDDMTVRAQLQQMKQRLVSA